MVKQATSTPDVYLVGPSGGKLRPWCGKCHKFLKSEGSAHDCTPVHLTHHSGSRKSTGGKRRIRLTDKNKSMLSKIFDAAAVGEDALRLLYKIREYSKKPKVSGKRLAKLAASFDKGLSKRGQKRASSLKKRFL